MVTPQLLVVTLFSCSFWVRALVLIVTFNSFARKDLSKNGLAAPPSFKKPYLYKASTSLLLVTYLLVIARKAYRCASIGI